ncbi:PilZ domain-containing protein [Candidatus Symbiobacter mobilis]|uniref:Cyclic diguanosine monophosphate-binding protein n=1 Tax=Candidatus Symbiobacter mobilis CR TaxID=946483 RepID=U5N962_9BURK|nr:PilZ domain-containing protein [Candidatus Symbiobacter mobilis]AGX88101.1 hypothetical protein Cenrod_2029 [Candidatus Symbiobacter mobilis CR]
MNIPSQGCQRLFSRVPFHAPVRLHLTNQTLDVELLDIALRGALVRIDTAAPVALQEPCRLVLPLATEEDSIEMHGVVVHLEGPNVGISCQDIDVASLTSLRRLLELNTGDAELMDRELSLLFAKR